MEITVKTNKQSLVLVVGAWMVDTMVRIITDFAVSMTQVENKEK